MTSQASLFPWPRPSVGNRKGPRRGGRSYSSPPFSARYTSSTRAGCGSFGGLLFLCPRLCIFFSLAWGFLSAEAFSMKELHLREGESRNGVSGATGRIRGRNASPRRLLFVSVSLGEGTARAEGRRGGSRRCVSRRSRKR